MMKTIEQAALEYAKKRYPKIKGEHEVNIDNGIFANSANSYIAGVKFAQRWISVEDELPKTNDGSVFVKLEDGRVTTSFMLEDGDFAYNVKPTHWRPIEVI